MDTQFFYMYLPQNVQRLNILWKHKIKKFKAKHNNNMERTGDNVHSFGYSKTFNKTVILAKYCVIVVLVWSLALT